MMSGREDQILGAARVRECRKHTSIPATRVEGRCARLVLRYRNDVRGFIATSYERPANQRPRNLDALLAGVVPVDE